MAVSAPPQVARLACIRLTVAQAPRLADFYERAFGFEVLGSARIDAGPGHSRMSGGGATVTTLRLGREVIEMAQFDEAGSPYPPGASASDLIFQHFAIVVSDMARAYERLLAVDGWTPISQGGPLRLPRSSGGVDACKFRDPEGHPLELLAFPAGRAPARWAGAAGAGPCLGVDHSAISVASSEASLAFYQGLGLRRTGGSLNQGPEQDRLDGLADTRVRVTALAPLGDGEGDGDWGGAGPHLELLCYSRREPSPPVADNDVAATRLVFEASPEPGLHPSDAPPLSLLDPDGHRVVIRPPADG
jgi:catechol 2,3-dioxygenase-like lactoylglutathione lyase family enzyme